MFDGVDLMARGDRHQRACAARIGMVFQSFNLYPHMTALGNVTLALRKVVGKPRGRPKRAGLAALDRVGLAEQGEVLSRASSPADSSSASRSRARSRSSPP